MSDYIMAQQNGRMIPQEDKIFGISNRAKAMIAEKGKDAVTNATIGALLDDNGDLIVLSSVADVLKNLTPADYSEYAPIGGTPQFRTDVQKAAFGAFVPDLETRAVATPGGTGAIRNTISNYSRVGDRVLTSDWFWAPYGSICQEIGRSLDTYELFDADRKYNIADFSRKVNEILAGQESIVIIINTPAHNPTGYSLSDDDWDKVIATLRAASADGTKKITLLVDVAYVDFAGDENVYRSFLPKLADMPENILVVLAYSLSKTFTMYGMRCGAMICMTKSAAIADEFKRVCEFSARATWSNCTRAAQTALTKIYADPALLEKVSAERAENRDMLIRRGRAFEKAAEEAGLVTVPFDSGFFASVPMDDPDTVCERLQKEAVFCVPLAKGLRVSVASISEEKCRRLPAKIKAAMSE